MEENFNVLAKDWAKKIPEKNYKIAADMIKRLNIGEGHNVLDVAAGTGILFSILKDKGFKLCGSGYYR